jgi:hypothetical protein
VQTPWHRSRSLKFNSSQLLESCSIENQQPYTICITLTPQHGRQNNSIILKLVEIYINKIKIIIYHLGVGTRYKNWFAGIAVYITPSF